MTDLLHTPITTLAQAETWAAAAPELASLPTFSQYKTRKALRPSCAKARNGKSLTVSVSTL